MLNDKIHFYMKNININRLNFTPYYQLASKICVVIRIVIRNTITIDNIIY